MKPSGIEWIGDIPDDWKLRKLLSLFKEHKDRNKNLKEQNLLSLSYGKIKRKDINNNDGLLPASFETYNIVENGNIVFRLTDLQNDKRSLRTGIVTQRGIITSAYVTIRPKIRLDSRFFHYLYHMYDICKVFYGMGDGVRQGMGFEDLKNIPTLIPPLKTQQKIADYLDKKCGEIDATIAKQKESIEKLKAYKQSLISETVTKGLDKSAPLKPSGIEWIGDIPSHWEIRKLKFLVALIDNKTKDGRSNSLENVESGTGKLIETENTYDGDGISFKENDLLFGKLRPYLAKVYLSSLKGRALGDFYVMRANKGINPNFLKFVLLSDWCIKIVDSSTYGTKMPRASWDFVGGMQVALPSIPEQNGIASYLETKCSEIDSFIVKKQNIIQKLDIYKKSLIFEYTTGKKRI